MQNIVQNLYNISMIVQINNCADGFLLTMQSHNYYDSVNPFIHIVIL